MTTISISQLLTIRMETCTEFDRKLLMFFTVHIVVDQTQSDLFYFLYVPNDEIILAHTGLTLYSCALLVCRHLRDPPSCSVSWMG